MSGLSVHVLRVIGATPAGRRCAYLPRLNAAGAHQPADVLPLVLRSAGDAGQLLAVADGFGTGVGELIAALDDQRFGAVQRLARGRHRIVHTGQSARPAGRNPRIPPPGPPGRPR